MSKIECGDIFEFRAVGSHDDSVLVAIYKDVPVLRGIPCPSDIDGESACWHLHEYTKLASCEYHLCCRDYRLFSDKELLKLKRIGSFNTLLTQVIYENTVILNK